LSLGLASNIRGPILTAPRHICSCIYFSKAISRYGAVTNKFVGAIPREHLASSMA
jgi:hypothetical protein